MNQKEEENFVIQYFREIYFDFPNGKLMQSESPDFILKNGPKKLMGIELTRLDPNASSLKEKIETTLLNKNDKIRLYQQKKLNAVWLIIHVDFIEESKSYNIQNKMNNWIFITEFDKVFLFDLFEKRVYHLFQE